jgi:chemotaxis protein histidine kinase CheA
MNAGLLDFFILEASEHVEHLDGLISRAESTPDLDAFSRHARAIRGSATMAKVGGIAELASSLESIVRGLRDGTVMWSVELKAALIAAVDDLKILIRGVRKWGADESDRATMRTFELSGFAPAFKRRQSMATAVVGSSSAGFLAAETADVAAGLARFADSCGPIAGHEDLIGRLRALRGVAALNDLPPLAEVIAVVDEAAKSLEISRTAPTTAQRNLLITASAVLREGSDALHAGGKPDSSSSAVQAFATAAAVASKARPTTTTSSRSAHSSRTTPVRIFCRPRRTRQRRRPSGSGWKSSARPSISADFSPTCASRTTYRRASASATNCAAPCVRWAVRPRASAKRRSR